MSPSTGLPLVYIFKYQLFKPWLALCVNLGLVGCLASQPNVEVQAPNDDAQCQSMGYHLGTSRTSGRQMFANNHIAEAQARGAAISDFGQRLQAAGAAAQSVNTPPPAPAMPQTTSCKPAWGGGMTCQTY